MRQHNLRRADMGPSDPLRFGDPVGPGGPNACGDRGRPSSLGASAGRRSPRGLHNARCGAPTTHTDMPEARAHAHARRCSCWQRQQHGVAGLQPPSPPPPSSPRPRTPSGGGGASDASASAARRPCGLRLHRLGLRRLRRLGGPRRPLRIRCPRRLPKCAPPPRSRPLARTKRKPRRWLLGDRRAHTRTRGPLATHALARKSVANAGRERRRDLLTYVCQLMGMCPMP